MSLDNFEPLERYTGNGLLDEYDFDFRITDASHLLVVVLDDNGEEIERFRGDDADPYMTTLTFDEDAGGGTITLADELPDLYTLVLLQAPDSPTQPSSFVSAGVFNLSYLESALDFIVMLIQRVSWLANRAVRIHDGSNVAFDPQLPIDLEPERTLVISSDGFGLALGPTLTELLQAASDAADAQAALTAALVAQSAAELAELHAETAETNAETAQTLAEAAQANAETAQALAEAALAAFSASGTGFISAGPFTCGENGSTALTGETTVSATCTQVDYVMRIVRGTTVFGRTEFSIFFRNGAWELVASADRYAVTALGVTFTVHATTGQITAVVDNSGAGNATIDAKKLNWAA